MTHATRTIAGFALRHVFLATIVATMLIPSAASAIPIALTDGTLTLQTSSLDFFVSDSVLHATGPDFSIFASSGPFFVPPTCSALCSPGSLFSGATSVFGAIQGGVTYAGLSEGVNDAPAAGFAFASWAVTVGTFTMPAIGAPFTLTEPFAIALDVSLATCDTCFASNGIHVHATGVGTATFSFAPDILGSHWALTSGVYQIETAEPSPWLLLVTGVACLFWFAIKGRRKFRR